MGLSERPLQLVGGRTCLDFVNTADWSADGAVVAEKLENDADVESLCASLAANKPYSALSSLRTYRRALRDIIVAAIDGAPPAAGDLAALDAVLSAIGNPGFAPADGPALASALSLEESVAVSAAALLGRESEIGRVKRCPGPDCGWLFLDESRNRRRTWCSMDTCGNRAKARRHYRRRKAAS